LPHFEIGARLPLFFMHIPKTAGRSVRMYLENQYDVDAICPAEDWQGVQALDRPLSDYTLIRGHFAFNMAQNLPGAKILTVLREPLRRTISGLRHMQRDPAFHALHVLARDMTLAEMLRDRQIMRAQRNVQTAYLCASASAERIAAFLALSSGGDAGEVEGPPSLDLALKRLRQVHFLGLMEDLPACIEELALAMHYHQVQDFPFINEDPNTRSEIDALTQDDLDILREANLLDLQLYAQAQSWAAQRRFESRMRALIAAGVYRVPPGSFEIDVGGVMPGSGWYPPERDASGSWRWTGPSNIFTLELPLRPDTEYNVNLRFRMPGERNPEGMRIALNGNPVLWQWTLSGSGEFEVMFYIDRRSLRACAGLCRISFEVTAERVPGELRRLGAAVNRIAFECIG
jgi:hypothetical protein